MPVLTIKTEGENRVFDIPVNKPVFIGRAKECDINLMSPGVSRRHAVIIARGGICGIKDLDSFNGTFLNGEAVTKPATLNNGDTIKISTFTIVFSFKPAELNTQSNPDSASGFDPRPSVRLRLPRAMTDTADLRSIMGDITAGKKARKEGEDTCIMPSLDSAAETIMDRPEEESEKK